MPAAIAVVHVDGNAGAARDSAEAIITKEGDDLCALGRRKIVHEAKLRPFMFNLSSIKLV